MYKSSSALSRVLWLMFWTILGISVVFFVLSSYFFGDSFAKAHLSSLDGALEEEADAFARNLLSPVPVVDVIRYNCPRQARGSVFGLPRAAWASRLDTLAEDRDFVDEDMANTLIWLFHDYLLGRRCRECGRVFTDFRQENRCPFCGAADPDWNLQGNEK